MGQGRRVNHSSSSLLCRLALALLAVGGFVAPLAQREVDGVVQTATGKPGAVASPAVAAPLVLAARVSNGVRAAPPATALAPMVRRWLLHRALLL